MHLDYRNAKRLQGLGKSEAIGWLPTPHQFILKDDRFSIWEVHHPFRYMGVRRVHGRGARRGNDSRTAAAALGIRIRNYGVRETRGGRSRRRLGKNAYPPPKGGAKVIRQRVAARQLSGIMPRRKSLIIERPNFPNFTDCGNPSLPRTLVADAGGGRLARNTPREASCTRPSSAQVARR